MLKRRRLKEGIIFASTINGVHTGAASFWAMTKTTLKTNRSDDVIQLTEQGLFCPAGDFYIDPWPRKSAGGVERAIVTHGHSDHARPGADLYLASPETVQVMHSRMGDIKTEIINYGEQRTFGDAVISLHPAGHVIGSTQVRIEVDGQVWVASGDYKRDSDPTCLPFEVVPCDTFITEATFSLPAYRWRPTAEVALDILDWWQTNAAQGRPSVLFGYSFGKAQRILAELHLLADLPRDQPILLHGAMGPLVQLYRELGVAMPETEKVSEIAEDYDITRCLALAPPSAAGSPWMRRFKNHSTGFASGWMRIRGNRRRRGYDRGFVVSDHADWPSLIRTIEETGASRVLATHGKTDVIVRYLNEKGIRAEALKTQFGEEES